MRGEFEPVPRTVENAQSTALGFPSQAVGGLSSRFSNSEVGSFPISKHRVAYLSRNLVSRLVGL